MSRFADRDIWRGFYAGYAGALLAALLIFFAIVWTALWSFDERDTAYQQRLAASQAQDQARYADITRAYKACTLDAMVCKQRYIATLKAAKVLRYYHDMRGRDD